MSFAFRTITICQLLTFIETVLVDSGTPTIPLNATSRRTNSGGRKARILNGLEVEWRDAPYQVKLFMHHNEVRSGIIINRKHILTTSPMIPISPRDVRFPVPNPYFWYGLGWFDENGENFERVSGRAPVYELDKLAILKPITVPVPTSAETPLYGVFRSDKWIEIADKPPGLHESMLVTGWGWTEHNQRSAHLKGALLYRVRDIPGLPTNTFLATGNKQLDDKFFSGFLSHTNSKGSNWIDEKIFPGASWKLWTYLYDAPLYNKETRNACIGDLGSPAVCNKGADKVLCGVVYEIFTDPSEPYNCSKGLTVIIDISNYAERIKNLG